MRRAVERISNLAAKLTDKSRVSMRMFYGSCLANLRYRLNSRDYSMTATVGLAVTDAGQGVAYGDYFTALELAAELEKAGLRVIYLRRHAGDWYCEAAKCETVISLLESFNPEKIKSTDSQSRPLCIAWARNWFDRWREAKGIHSYDLLLASSETAAAYLSSETGLNAELFPLATSAPRFYQKAGVTAYQRDLCFTGSYWYKPREIERLLDVSRLSNYRLDIFGENWENSEKFSSFWRGFLDYEALPEVYKTTKIVLDDANFATKPYGAVNSRVYDALAAGALVLTNGGLGAKETFNGLLPVYSSSEELHRQIDFYLSDEEARLAKILELQDFVLAQHTYAHRVTQLLKLLAQNKSLPDSRGGH